LHTAITLVSRRIGIEPDQTASHFLPVALMTSVCSNPFELAWFGEGWSRDKALTKAGYDVP
jgi:hypothetical protein